MKKVTITTMLALCALMIAPSLSAVEAALPAEVCYQVSCRGSHKPLSVRVCGATDAEAQAAARKALTGHNGQGHAPTMNRMR